MAMEKEDIVKDLEDVILRLEEARSDAMEFRVSNDMGLHDAGFESDMPEMMERAEAAVFEAGNCIDELIQIIGEEIDNLHGIEANLE
jgi:hypothetical protein